MSLAAVTYYHLPIALVKGKTRKRNSESYQEKDKK